MKMLKFVSKVLHWKSSPEFFHRRKTLKSVLNHYESAKASFKI